ncbi:MAG: regulator of chromosome condensation, partial [Verrucomicrobiales bacterium]|nr:regulator of chromosome condensation [Verrucomicrobiales bacterium]
RELTPMNFLRLKLRILLLILVVGNSWMVGRVHAVTVTVSPVAISNLYNGAITLVITNGLTNGETVLIEKFGDFNTNGAVDAGELLVQSFLTTDGQATVVGGVTNLSVPGDLTSIDGAIVSRINFSGIDPQQIVGNFVFRVSSPTGRFTPATATFAVTNSNFGQSISGIVRHNGTNVPNASVFFMAGPNQDFAGDVLADSSGNFTFKAPPGDYAVGAAKAGYVYDFSTAPHVTLTAGGNISTNVPLIVGTRTISGSLRKMGTTNGLAGVLMPWESQNGAFILSFTDANGNFNVPVTADQWKIKMQESAIASLGFLPPRDSLHVDTTSGNISNLNIEMPKADALFYGQLKNNSNVPLVGIEVFAENQNSYTYAGTSITDTNGNYFIGVVGTNWNVGPSSEDLSPLGYSANETNLNISSGQAIQLNFIAQLLTIHLGGRVVNGSGNPVGNIQMIVGAQNGPDFSGNTDNDGYFNIGLTA